MAGTTGHIVDQMIRTSAGAPPADASDRDLLRRFGNTGDEKAFAALVRRHSDLVLGVCRRSLATVQDAEDAYQATFLLLAQKAGTERWQPSVANWLYATARKVARNARRSAERRARREGRAAVPEAVAPIDTMTGRELLAVLDEELDKLSPIYREPLVLCYLAGLTREEAAARLQVLAATVKTRLERARKRLGRALARRGCGLGVGVLALAAVSRVDASSPRLLGVVLRAAGGRPSAAVAALAKSAATKETGKWAWAAVLIVGAATAGIGFSRGTPTAKPPVADLIVPAKAEAPSPKEPPKADEVRTVNGRVVGPDGRPVKGAVICDVEYQRDSTGPTGRGLGTVVAETDADGLFTAKLPAIGPRRVAVMASAPGVGVAWVPAAMPERGLPDGELNFKLVSDRPISGRLIDTQGRPVAGATVGVIDVIAPLYDDFDRLVASVRTEGFGRSGQWKDVLLVSHGLGAGPVVTDKDGRFELSGLGGDRVVSVGVFGQGIARTSGFVFNRPGLDIKALNAGWAGRTGAQEKGRHPVIFGPTPTFVVEPGFAVEGTVRDADTGKPVPGCRLQLGTGFWDWVATKTDAEGKYRIDGVARGMGYFLSTNVPHDTDWMDRFLDFNDPTGFETVRQDIKLARGAVFAGRVVDKSTGKGVQASFQILPKGDNPNLSRPEFESAGRDMTWKGTGTDGKFRIVTVPGKSEVRVSTAACDRLYGQMFTPYRPHDPFTVDLAAGREKEIVVELDRGRTAERTVVDAAGNPLTGLVTAGLAINHDLYGTDSVLITIPPDVSKVTVYGMGSAEVRDVLLVHPERKLARLARVKAGTKDTVKLFPLQPITGRLLDADGKPLAGLSVAADYFDFGVRQAVNRHTKFLGIATTDADGRFTIPDAITGISFNLTIRKGGAEYVGMPRLGAKWIMPGFPLNLGDRKVEPAR
jgi:RNA polymerase sigma factor (sigma-70 family)